MPEVVVMGSFTAEPGKEAEGLDALRSLVEPTHQEGGSILYALHRGTDDPRRLAFVERWSSRELLDAHLGRVEEQFGQSGDIFVYEPVPGGEPANGSLAEHGGRR